MSSSSAVHENCEDKSDVNEQVDIVLHQLVMINCLVAKLYTVNGEIEKDKYRHYHMLKKTLLQLDFDFIEPIQSLTSGQIQNKN